ncbi:MAG: peptide chain release factor N(5)-glutamine methyltransferase [Candidatus Omnitrophica bacterium]|nr:peptide chain release factor N(5)-glutamine methyltransferase [Candidatus Omnitrophota bacterium]
MTEAEVLFSQVLNCDRMSLYSNRALILNEAAKKFISSVLKRRIQGEPIQYILGKTEFMGLEFKVCPGVLIPRPETEVLVETVIKKAKSQEPGTRSLNLLDLGTGSGCIAISLAKLLHGIEISAIDLSETALEVAKENAVLNQVSERIKFMKSDLFAQYPVPRTPYDFIISNPPYIASGEIDTLQPEIAHEPRIALDGGKDGLDFYRRLAVAAGGHLKENGLLVLEIGFGQLERIKNIFQNSKNFEVIEVVKDYVNIDRVVVVKKLGEEKWIN